MAIMNINIGKLLQNRAVLMGEKEAFVHQSKRWTFRQMNERANGFANYLEKLGLSKGDRIGLLCKNNEDFVAVLMGAAKNWGCDSCPQLALTSSGASIHC